MNKDQINKLNNLSEKFRRSLQLTAGISILSVIFMKYIPIVNMIKGKIGKLFVIGGLIIGPSVFVLSEQV